MPKAAPRSKSRTVAKKPKVQTAKAKSASSVASSGRNVASNGSKKKQFIVLKPDAFGFVNFSYQNVAYQIDVDKSKVYRRFIEVEKSKQGSIISAYRTVATGPSL